MVGPGAHLVAVFPTPAGGSDRYVLGITGSPAGLGKHHRILCGKHLFGSGHHLFHVGLDVLIGNDWNPLLVIFYGLNGGKAVTPAAFGISIFLDPTQKFLILHAKADTVVGRIWGLEDRQLLVSESFSTAVRIPVEQILRSVTRQQYDPSSLEKLRVRYRYWTANFDLAFGFTDATTDTNSLSTALEPRRKKKPMMMTP